MISTTIDYAIDDEISLGGYYGSAKSTLWLYGSQIEKNNYTIVGARGLYHVDLTPKLNTYGGVLLGIIFINTTIPGTFGRSNTIENNVGLIYHAFVGARFRFTKNIGIYSELGVRPFNWVCWNQY